MKDALLTIQFIWSTTLDVTQCNNDVYFVPDELLNGSQLLKDIYLTWYWSMHICMCQLSSMISIQGIYIDRQQLTMFNYQMETQFPLYATCICQLLRMRVIKDKYWSLVIGIYHHYVWSNRSYDFLHVEKAIQKRDKAQCQKYIR